MNFIDLFASTIEKQKLNIRHNYFVSGISSDSRTVKQGHVFFLLEKPSLKNLKYVKQAINLGALGVVFKGDFNPKDGLKNSLVVKMISSKIAFIESSKIDKLLFRSLELFYKKQIDVIEKVAITGTNGKTSTSFILESLFDKLDMSCGVIGTIDHHFLKNRWKTNLTTPTATQIYSRIKDFVDLGARSFVCEASSHGLKQNRLAYMRFNFAIFLNMTRDHLDYHSDMEDYFNSKNLLFKNHISRDGTAIFNLDDKYSKRAFLAHSGAKLSFGLDSASDVKISNISCDLSGASFTLEYKKETFDFRSSLIGVFNVYNLTAAISILLAKGFSLQKVASLTNQIDQIPGRLERVNQDQDRFIFVDYAHTPDALEASLDSLIELKPNKQNKIICLFGCGGDRDQGKRPLMGKMASLKADLVILTSDNPRSEKPDEIINQIMEGVDKSSLGSDNDSEQKIFIEAERRKAIKLAVSLSKPGDIVLIAGKGHEQFQEINGEKIHFSDVEEINKIFNGEDLK